MRAHDDHVTIDLLGDMLNNVGWVADFESSVKWDSGRRLNGGEFRFRFI
jgi:hypothetical protein